MKHDKSYSRDQDYRHAVKRRRIDRELSSYIWHDWYNNLHQYSKNKIHCSCGLCACKTNGSRARRHSCHTTEPAENWSTRDRRQIEDQENQLDELETENNG